MNSEIVEYKPLYKCIVCILENMEKRKNTLNIMNIRYSLINHPAHVEQFGTPYCIFIHKNSFKTKRIFMFYRAFV